MTTEAIFFGGAKFTTLASSADVSVAFGSDRVQTYKNSSGSTVNVILPMPSMFASWQLGGPTWYINNDSTSGNNLTLKFSVAGGGTTTLATVQPGKCAVVAVMNCNVGSESYQVIIRTKGTPRTFGTGARQPIETPEATQTFDPYCFEGSDCEYAASIGNAPLDGLDGRDEVVAPMFQGIADIATNNSREPIRASDEVMPSIVVLRFAKDEFAVDGLHPYGTGLIDEFFTALANNDRPWGLEYQGDATGTSDHWHHIRWKGINPTDGWELKTGGLTVNRYTWQATKKYGPIDDPERYTLDVRFVMEHNVTPVPEVECGGGQNDTSFGAWGAVFHVYVFTDEVMFGSADPVSYTPVGGASMSFTRDNPARWGLADGVPAGSEADKFCHPQMVICGHIPTSFQAPVGKNWVPIINRKYGMAFMGAPNSLMLRNREYCYEVGNGSPWCTCNNSPNAISASMGIEGNIVFGTSIGGYNLAAMTMGGDVPTSSILQFVTLENGTGVGRTILKPAKPGWDEDCGELDIAGGSSVSIGICTGANDCGDPADCDDGSGKSEWPGCKVSPCSGHPAEPLEGIGGTHRCFNPNTSPTCCVAIQSTLTNILEVCSRTTTIVGNYNGSGCDVVSSGCTANGTWWTQLVLFVEDYDYNFGGNQLLRSMSFSRLLPDPTFGLRSYSYDQASHPDLHADIGAWTYGAGYVETSAYGISGAVRAALMFDTGARSDNWYGFTIQGTTKKLQSGTHGVGALFADGGPQANGYGALMYKSSSTQITIQINRYVAGVKTILVSQVVLSTADEVPFTWSYHGTDLSFTALGVTLEVQDCMYSDGELDPAIFSEDTAGTNTKFVDLVFTELVPSILVETTGSVAYDFVGIDWDPKTTIAYGLCSGSFDNGGCNTPPHCNCSTWTETLVGTYSQSWDGPTMTIDLCNNDIARLGGPNPNCDCDGPWCGDSTPPCGACPPPFVAINFLLPKSCKLKGEEITEGNACSGVTVWNWTTIVCA